MIIVEAPLRLSFLGGGTDFEDFYLKHGGAVLSSAINKRIYIIVKERFDDMIYVNYSQKEIVDDVGKLKHDLVREAIRLSGITRGIEITTLADVPSEGTGLGSSSALTVGLLQALYAYQGITVTAATLAEEACHIEVEILGRPIGRQDQYIAAYGNTQFITFNGNGIKMEPVPVSPEDKRKLSDSLLLFYTGNGRRSSDILAEQKSNIGKQISTLNQLKVLAYKAREALCEGSLDELGEIMHQGWELKKGLASKITNPLIDDVYQRARRAGAIGGKISGAGGGGFLLLYCRREKQDDVRQAVNGLRELPFRFQPDGSKVIFNYQSAA